MNSANSLVVYSNIFQENMLFAREYEDISSELSLEKKKMFNQQIKVQPLTGKEIAIVNDGYFISEKRNAVLLKSKKYK